MTSSGLRAQIARKQRGSQMHKELQRVRIPRRERIQMERGLLAMDFRRYYDMRHKGQIDTETGNRIYIDPETGDRYVMEDHYLPAMLPHGNLALRSVEHEALINILGRAEPVEYDPAVPGHKWCGGNAHWVLLDDEHFWKNETRKDGYQNWCIDCLKKKNNASYRRAKAQIPSK